MSESNELFERRVAADRRDFLKLAGLSTAHVIAGAIPAIARSQSLSHDSIIRMSLVEGVKALASGKISAQEYCTAALAQAAKFECYQILTQTLPTYVREAAAAADSLRKEGKAIGALHGVPYVLKDSIDMVEYYTMSGHPALQTFEPLVDADLVKLYKESHGICIGKAQLAPLSMWVTTENPLTGDTGNPFNKAYKSGGSSGGSGAAVAARIVPFAVGADTGGSVRLPAALNGVQGFRPTTGRWPTAGTMPVGFSDTLGPIARTVADIKWLDTLSAVDRPENRPSAVSLRSVRIAYQKSGFLQELHPWVEENFEQTLSTLSRVGATLVEVKNLPLAESGQAAVPILAADVPGAIARYFNRHHVYDRSVFGLLHGLQVDALKKMWLPALDRAPEGEIYFDLVVQLMKARQRYRDILSEHRIDALLYPTTKVPNTPNDGAETFVGKGPQGEQISEFSIGANMLFAPAMRTPSVALFSGLDRAGLPLSVTLDGYRDQDRRLLDIAETIEKVLPPVVEPKTI
jgi:indoleacetamide hydrolase